MGQVRGRLLSNRLSHGPTADEEHSSRTIMHLAEPRVWRAPLRNHAATAAASPASSCGVEWILFPLSRRYYKSIGLL